jgi:plasmid stabilization system protein ParE
MTRLALGAGARRDLARLAEFLAIRDPAAAEATVDLIIDALRILEQHPRIGRPASNRLRELIIHRGRTGYIALYRVGSDEQDVEVLAIRHQRESGYHQEDL